MVNGIAMHKENGQWLIEQTRESKIKDFTNWLVSFSNGRLAKLKHNKKTIKVINL